MRTEDINEMLELQKDYDKMVFSKHNTDYSEVSRKNGIFYAVLDEIGEWNHENKPLWCWWKFGVGEVERSAALQEYIDVVHFVLSYCIGLNGGEVPQTGNIVGSLDHRMPTLIIGLLQLLNREVTKHKQSTVDDIPRILKTLFSIGRLCGFGDWEILDEYKRKNEINRERVRTGY